MPENGRRDLIRRLKVKRASAITIHRSISAQRLSERTVGAQKLQFLLQIKRFVFRCPDSLVLQLLFLGVFRSAEWDLDLRMPYGRCEVKSTGNVSCVPSTSYFILCAPDLTYWPYDQVNCSLRLGAWMQKGEEINLTTLQDDVSSTKFEQVNLQASHRCYVCK